MTKTIRRLQKGETFKTEGSIVPIPTHSPSELGILSSSSPKTLIKKLNNKWLRTPLPPIFQSAHRYPFSLLINIIQGIIVGTSRSTLTDLHVFMCLRGYERSWSTSLDSSGGMTFLSFLRPACISSRTTCHEANGTVLVDRVLDPSDPRCAFPSPRSLGPFHREHR